MQHYCLDNFQFLIPHPKCLKSVAMNKIPRDVSEGLQSHELPKVTPALVLNSSCLLLSLHSLTMLTLSTYATTLQGLWVLKVWFSAVICKRKQIHSARNTCRWALGFCSFVPAFGDGQLSWRNLEVIHKAWTKCVLYYKTPIKLTNVTASLLIYHFCLNIKMALTILKCLLLC